MLHLKTMENWRKKLMKLLYRMKKMKVNRKLLLDLDTSIIRPQFEGLWVYCKANRYFIYLKLLFTKFGIFGVELAFT